MQCIKCGHFNKPDSNFCELCGNRLVPAEVQKSLVATCPSCGHMNDPASKFCVICGSVMNTGTSFGGDIPIKTFWVEKHLGDKKLGYSKASGNLKVYSDRVEFVKQLGNALAGAVFGVMGMIVASKKVKENGDTETYHISDIKSCFFSQYAIAVPSMVIVLKSGDVIKFAGYTKSKDINECVSIINENMRAFSAVTNQNTTFDDYEQFSFAMPINNMAVVDEQSIAIIGSVAKGSVKAGDMLSIISKDNENKGTFEVRSVAVNKIIAPSANMGDIDTALLIFCPPAYVKQGDKACVPIR